MRPWPRPVFPPPPRCGEGTGACSLGAGGLPITAVSKAPGPCFNAWLKVLRLSAPEAQVILTITFDSAAVRVRTSARWVGL